MVLWVVIPPTRLRRESLPEAAELHREQLRRGMAELQLDADALQLSRFLEYLDLLCKWNKSYNLTAVRDAPDMITRHLLDSLAVAPWIVEDSYIDVGTGAGLPGIPLAILFPDKQFHLLDSNGKKTRFLFQVKTALGLDNMVVHQARVESFRAEQPYAGVLSRAFASLDDMLLGCEHLLSDQGRLLALKGAWPAAELAAIEDKVETVAVHAIVVPGLAEQRHLVEISLRQANCQH